MRHARLNQLINPPPVPPKPKAKAKPMLKRCNHRYRVQQHELHLPTLVCMRCGWERQ